MLCGIFLFIFLIMIKLDYTNLEKEKQSPDSDIMKIKDGGGAEGVITKVPEYEVNMKVAVKLKDLLEKNNFNVIMTKTTHSESPGNIERANVGNDNNAYLEIRIHCDRLIMQMFMEHQCLCQKSLDMRAI